MFGKCSPLPARREFSRRPLLIITLAFIVIGALSAVPRMAASDPLFAPFRSFDAGSHPSCVAIGDLNGDGIPDLVLANSWSDNVSVLLGNGDGTFGAKTDFGTGVTPFSVAIGDLNRDGIPDLAVANHGYLARPGTVSVLLGLGDGTFGAKTDVWEADGAYSLAIGDLNADGNPDLAVAICGRDPSPNLPGSGTVLVLLGEGDGTFQAKASLETGINPISVAIGDLNRDGNLDLAVANYGSNTVSVLLGNGIGSFGARTDFATGRLPRSVAIGDLNGDGKPDLAVANGGDYNTPGNTVSVLLGDGKGAFGPKTDFATGLWPVSVAIGDLNGDRNLDLAVTNVYADTGLVADTSYTFSVSVLLGDGKGTFGAKTDFETGYRAVSVAIGDLNGDGKLDLAVANMGTNTASVFLNASASQRPGPAGLIAGAAVLRVRAWPNPIVDGTAISYSLPERTEVAVCVYDVTGRLVSTVARGGMAAGEHEVRWNPRGAGGVKADAGIYLVEVRAGTQRMTTRVAVLP